MIKMALIFDKNGNLIHDIVNTKIKHNENEIIELQENLDGKYYCSKCERFHKQKYRGNLNQTFIKHIRFSIQISDSFIYNKKLSKSFKTYDIEKHRRSKGSSKQ